MDSQATWDQLLVAYAVGDWDGIEEHAGALLSWLDRGGFPPRVLPRDDPEAWNLALAEAGCRHALSAVRGRWSLSRNPIPTGEREDCDDC
jgi:hypothetical protein